MIPAAFIKKDDCVLFNILKHLYLALVLQCFLTLSLLNEAIYRDDYTFQCAKRAIIQSPASPGMWCVGVHPWLICVNKCVSQVCKEPMSAGHSESGWRTTALPALPALAMAISLPRWRSRPSISHNAYFGKWLRCVKRGDTRVQCAHALWSALFIVSHVRFYVNTFCDSRARST